jgi:hypothetical protein
MLSDNSGFAYIGCADWYYDGNLSYNEIIELNLLNFTRVDQLAINSPNGQLYGGAIDLSNRFACFQILYQSNSYVLTVTLSGSTATATSASITELSDIGITLPSLMVFAAVLASSCQGKFLMAVKSIECLTPRLPTWLFVATIELREWTLVLCVCGVCGAHTQI